LEGGIRRRTGEWRKILIRRFNDGTSAYPFVQNAEKDGAQMQFFVAGSKEL
jgi:hypothetical protein